MKYISLLMVICIISCNSLDNERTQCIKENYTDILQNQESMLFDELLIPIMNEYLNKGRDNRIYFHDSLSVFEYKIGIDSSSKHNKDILSIYTKIEEASSDMIKNSKRTVPISFNAMENIKKYSNIIPMRCNENFTVRDGWEIAFYTPGYSKDSTVCCIVMNILQCGDGCWGEELVILHNTNNKWKLKAKIILKTGS